MVEEAGDVRPLKRLSNLAAHDASCAHGVFSVTTQLRLASSPHSHLCPFPLEPRYEALSEREQDGLPEVVPSGLARFPSTADKQDSRATSEWDTSSGLRSGVREVARGSVKDGFLS